MTPRLGTDGNSIVYPVRGIHQVARQLKQSPQLPTAAYVTVLVLAAMVTAVGLIVAGYTIRSWAAVLALGLAAAIAERISVKFDPSSRKIT